VRVLVTGSRNWTAANLIWQVLHIVASEHCTGNRFWVRHGGCPEGADLAAHIWCEYHAACGPDLYVTEETMRAAWALGKGAGFARNRRMVDSDTVDLCIAFIAPCIKADCAGKPHGSHGATDCANYAESQGVQTWRYSA
jgi:YspA, cpYpsA-related SLOG family